MAAAIKKSLSDGASSDLPTRASEPRDLDQRRHVLSGMLQLTHMMNEAIDNAGGSEVANNTEALVLLSLYLDGPQRPRRITTLAGLTRGGTTNLVDRLEANGLVARRPVADDRRGVLIQLTAHGTEVIERVATAVNGVLNFASPLVDGWKQHFTACGCELGARWIPRGGRQVLDHARRLGAAGATIAPAYDAAFGTDDPSRYHTLHVLLLATEPGGTRPTWISDATRLSSAGTTELLDRMESSGLVVRIAGAPPDRRVSVVTATERGRAALDTVLTGSDATMRATAEVLFPVSRPARRSTRRRA